MLSRDVCLQPLTVSLMIALTVDYPSASGDHPSALAQKRIRYPQWQHITFQQSLIKVNMELAYDSAILFLSMCPRELKTGVQIKICTQVGIAALSEIAKGRNNPNGC